MSALLRARFDMRLVVLVAPLLVGSPLGTARAAEQPVRNVIVLVADGCSSEQYTLARWFRGAPLSVDSIYVGAVKTWIADSVIADSAPAATAYATGYRSSDDLVGIGPHGKTLSVFPRPPAELVYRPLASVLEGARLSGRATGIVVTSSITHATPAAYFAHVPLRKLDDDIMEQAVHQNVDVAFGGGRQYLVPASAGGKRADGENLLDVLKTRGYQIVASRDEMRRVVSGRVFGLFAMLHMAPEIDRPHLAPHEPTLEEMTCKAIELLAQDPDGFFLMVEASQVDWACHANDPAHLLSDLLMFDRAVAAALEFARKDGRTLVLALSDHNTGGMSIGNAQTSDTYSQTSVDALLAPLRTMDRSSRALWAMVEPDKTPERVRHVVRQHWGMEIGEDEARQILTVAARDKDNPHNAFGEVLCPKHTVLGWTTHGHCGGDVPLFAYGPGKHGGLYDAPEIGALTATALGLDLAQLNQRLFVDAAQAIPGGKVTIDQSDKANPVVVVEVHGRRARLPVNKNLLQIEGNEVALEGVVVYAPNTGRAYLPAQAIRRLVGR